MECPDSSNNYPVLVEVTVSFCGHIYKIIHNTEWHKWYRECVSKNKSYKILISQLIINDKYTSK